MRLSERIADWWYGPIHKMDAGCHVALEELALLAQADHQLELQREIVFNERLAKACTDIEWLRQRFEAEDRQRVQNRQAPRPPALSFEAEQDRALAELIEQP